MINKMTPADLRELDVWIAIHVYGWQWWLFKSKDGKHTWCSLCDPSGKWMERQGGVLVDHPRIDDVQDLGSVSHYTINAISAMELLKLLRFKISYQRELRLQSDIDGGLHVSCRVDGEDMTVWGGTDEIAICLFAKKFSTKGTV